MVNAIGHSINSVRLDPSSSDVWTDDVMGQGVRGDGETVEITLAGKVGAGNCDLEVEGTQDDPATVRKTLDLRSIWEVGLT